MKDIEPRFFDTENNILAHLEWEAIRVIYFDGSHTGHAYDAVYTVMLITHA